MNSIVQKPWGYYEILKSGKRFLVKKLFVKPGGMLSLQNHEHRSEHWLVAEGEVEVTLDKKTINLVENENIFIPKGALHRIANQGSKDLGYQGLSDLWFSKYDMPADEFLNETDRVWEEVKPLYDALHCHVRAKLNEHYGDNVVPESGPLPVHLLGNMWGQSWSNIYDLVYTEESQQNSVDVTKIIEEKGLNEIEMVEYAEDFFLSIGFDPLPDTFWERSLFVKPRDRSVVCHASAWNLDPANNDLRIKMCIEKNEEDFVTIHHELGHIFKHIITYLLYFRVELMMVFMKHLVTS